MFHLQALTNLMLTWTWVTDDSYTTMTKALKAYTTAVVSNGAYQEYRLTDDLGNVFTANTPSAWEN